jgi:hypothetical protein
MKYEECEKICNFHSRNPYIKYLQMISACSMRGRCSANIGAIRANLFLLYSSHSSPNIIRVMESRRLRWTGHAACVERSKVAYSILVGI